MKTPTPLHRRRLFGFSMLEVLSASAVFTVSVSAVSVLTVETLKNGRRGSNNVKMAQVARLMIQNAQLTGLSSNPAGVQYLAMPPPPLPASASSPPTASEMATCNNGKWDKPYGWDSSVDGEWKYAPDFWICRRVIEDPASTFPQRRIEVKAFRDGLFVTSGTVRHRACPHDNPCDVSNNAEFYGTEGYSHEATITQF